MVNIASIVQISVNSGQVTSFPSYTAYYNHILLISPPNWRVQQMAIRRRFTLCERALHHKYEIPLLDLANVCLVFGSVANTLVMMQDDYWRYNVCNPENIIIIQFRNRPHTTEVISTFHRKFDYDTTTSSQVYGEDTLNPPNEP